MAETVSAGCGAGSETSAVDASTPPGEQPGSREEGSSTAVIDQSQSTSKEPERGDPATDGPEIERAAIEVDFHRTRVGPGGGFWVLAEVHNDRPTPVDAVQVEVALVDEAGVTVGRAKGGLRRVIDVDESAAVSVLVEHPPLHDQLKVEARAHELADESAPTLPLHLEHAPPERAELGGWFVTGEVRNDGGETVTGARLEILGVDQSGKLLGQDWLELDPIDAGETVAFAVSELRYDEQPARLQLMLRPPKR